MNRRLKRAAAVMMTLMMFITVFGAQMFTSYAATGKIMFSDPTATVGEQVSVRLKITSTDGTALGASDLRLEYDSSALEFLNGTSANGGAGSIRVLGAMESANQTTFTFSLKFKALKAGTTNIKVVSQEVYDANSRAVTIEHVGSSAVKITAPVTYSKDASLSSLTIAPGELTPVFDSDVMEYSAVVGSDVEKVTVSAPATHDKASVAVEGNENLQIGENTITCKVTAEDGETSKTYKIVVTKTEAAQTEPESTASAPSEGGSAENLLEGNWTVAAEIDPSAVPEGFTVIDFTYDGQPVQAASDQNGNVILYMTNEDGAGDFFLYDEENSVLVPYVFVRIAEKTVIVLDPEEMPEDMVIPEGFASCVIDIGNHTVEGWVWNDGDSSAPEYCVVYGQNEKGERNLYRYDQKEMTLQRFFQDPESENLRTKYSEIAGTYSSLLEDYKTRGTVIMALIGACVVLGIVVIVLLVRKPKAAEDEEPVEEFIPTERRKASKAKAEEAVTDITDEEDAEAEEIDLVEIDEEIDETANEKDEPETEVKEQKDPKKKTETESEEDDDFEFIDLEL